MTNLLAAESKALWALSNEIRSCRNGGPGDLDEATEEVECILMHSEYESIRRRCRKLLATDNVSAGRVR